MSESVLRRLTDVDFEELLAVDRKLPEPRPIYEILPALIRGTCHASLPLMITILRAVEIKENFDSILAAWENKKREMEWADFGITAIILAQKKACLERTNKLARKPAFKVGDPVTWTDDHVIFVRAACLSSGEGPFPVVEVRDYPDEDTASKLGQIIVIELENGNKEEFSSLFFKKA